MFYLKNTTEAQVIFFPRNGEGNTGNMTLVLRNTINQEETMIPVTELNTSARYYNTALTLPEGVNSGEYRYSLSQEGIELSCGLLIIGETTSPNQYNKKVTYKQYESE